MNEEVLSQGGLIKSFTPFYKRFSYGGEHGKSHTKYFSILQIAGRLRKKTLFEECEIDEHGRKSKEKLLPPRFEKVEVLAKKMFAGHKPALKALLDILAIERESFMWSLVDLEEQGF